MNEKNVRRRLPGGEALKGMGVLFFIGMLFTACAWVPNVGSQEAKGREATAFGWIKVRAIGPYSRGYETQLRFFHLLNRSTQERIRVNVQSSATAFGLALPSGDYEVIRVQINEGPMMMESHVSLRFHVRPNAVTYLGTWEFDVDTPRTQRMLRIDASPEHPLNRSQNEGATVVSLPEIQSNKVRLYVVAPYPKISYYYR